MKYLTFSLIVLLLFSTSCNTTSSETADSKSLGTSIKQKEPSGPISGICTNGVKYELFTDGKGKKPKFKDYLSLNLSHSTVTNDSMLFSSFDREKPIQMRFTESLFGGAINEGLLLMTEGDSAVFLIPAQLLYRRLPTFVKRGENIMYNVKLIEVIDNPMLSK